jgi:hypothetical protein
LVEGLRDAANVADGALIFGQVLSDRPFSSTLAALGIFTWLALLTFATVLAGRRE